MLKRFLTVFGIGFGVLFVPVWIFRLQYVILHALGEKLDIKPSDFEIVIQWLIGSMIGLLAFVVIMGAFAIAHWVIYGDKNY